MGDGRPPIAAARAGAAAGVAGACSATLSAAIVHTLFLKVPFPPVSVAGAVVRLTPGAVATFFIETLGHLALPLAVVATFLAFVAAAAALGFAMPTLSRRVGVPAAAVLLGAPLYLVGVTAMSPDVQTVTRVTYGIWLLPSFAAGAWVTVRAYRRLTDTRVTAGDTLRTRDAEHDPSRRAVVRSLGVGGAGLVLGWSGVGRLISRRPNPGRLPLHVAVAEPAPAPSPAAGDAAFRRIAGLSPEITSNARFYVVDEEIIDPDVDPGTWALEVDGLVDRPFRLTYEELTALPAVERFVTLECISNPVGGDLMSTAKWTGVPLEDLLRRAGVREGAREVVSTALGGYSDSLPLDEAMGNAFVAIGMNDRVLPREHGFPARLIAPGRYGMKQPKWLTGVEVVDRPYTGYWEARGWSKAAIVKTTARIDTVTDDPVDVGVVVAGVAFAGDRGISRVEVSLDGGTTWKEAELKTALSSETWRLWRFPFKRGEGDVRIYARATDGEGREQIQAVADPHPSGASGYDGVTDGP